MPARRDRSTRPARKALIDIDRLLGCGQCLVEFDAPDYSYGCKHRQRLGEGGFERGRVGSNQLTADVDRLTADVQGLLQCVGRWFHLSSEFGES
jgi:hypothetical protein